MEQRIKSDTTTARKNTREGAESRRVKARDRVKS
jgi:hypothetical protein